MTNGKKAEIYMSQFGQQVISKLHKMVELDYLDDEQMATLLIRTIDEAEQLLNPIQSRLQAEEDRQMELLPQ